MNPSNHYHHTQRCIIQCECPPCTCRDVPEEQRKYLTKKK